MPGKKRMNGKGDGSYPGPKATAKTPGEVKGNTPMRIPVTPASGAGRKAKVAKAGVSRKTGMKRGY